MDSIKFPDMFSSTTTNTVLDEEATSQNLNLLLTSEQGSLFGDPFFGLNLRHNAFEQNYYEIWDDLLLDKIYQAIVDFMPQIRVERKGIKLNRDHAKGVLSVDIVCTNQSNFKTNMYNIVLLKS